MDKSGRGLLDSSQLDGSDLTNEDFLEKEKSPFEDNIVNSTPDNQENFENFEEDVFDDELTEISANELGTFDLKITRDSQYHTVFKSKIKEKEEKISGSALNIAVDVNIVDFFNLDKNPYDYNFSGFTKKKEIITYFQREINEYQKFQLVETDQSNEPEPEDINDVRLNTKSSFIYQIQKNYCLQDNFPEAVEFNKSYQERKRNYEVNLIKKIIQHFEDPDKKKEIQNQNLTDAYTDLVNDSKKLLEDYKNNGINQQNMKDMKIVANSIIIKFVSKIKEMSEKDKTILELKKTATYTMWKKRFSELINIWELYSSNGIELKFTYKYLILKHYYTNRAFERINGVVKKDEKKVYSIWEKLTGQDEDPFACISIYKNNSTTRTVLLFILTLAYLYSCFLLAFRFYIKGFDNNLYESVERSLDILFFIDMIYSFRTIYKDNSNNEIDDLTKIFYRYVNQYLPIDMITIIPWEIFIKGINNTVYELVRQFRNIIKLLRINKISLFLAPLETTTFANTYRFMKILIFFLIILIWMGCLTIFAIDSSIIYNRLQWSLYTTSFNTGRTTMKTDGLLMMALYTGPYIVVGRTPAYFQVEFSLYKTSDYVLLILEFALGIIVNTYILGGVTDILKNLNQGENFFTQKTDMLVEHMVFYDVSVQTQTDLKVYYDYLWQRHKDIIYGKRHFAILSESLRERFENLNLPHNRLYLAKFYNLNLGNLKLVGKILMTL
jgi:hypothetical protein